MSTHFGRRLTEIRAYKNANQGTRTSHVKSVHVHEHYTNEVPILALKASSSLSIVFDRIDGDGIQDPIKRKKRMLTELKHLRDEIDRMIDCGKADVWWAQQEKAKRRKGKR